MPYSLSILHTTDFDLPVYFNYLVQYDQHVISKYIIISSPITCTLLPLRLDICYSLSLYGLLYYFPGKPLLLSNLALTVPSL